MLTIDINLGIILLNGLLAGMVAATVTDALFWFISRILGYDYIFCWETGQNFLTLADGYSDKVAGWGGFGIHLLLGAGLLILHGWVWAPLLAAFAGVGPFHYNPEPTARQENMIWLSVMGVMVWGAIMVKRQKLDPYSIFLLLYSLTFTLVAGALFGFYFLGKPGLIY